MPGRDEFPSIEFGNPFSFLAGDLKTEIDKLYFILQRNILFQRAIT